jgi:hypothetical protein
MKLNLPKPPSQHPLHSFLHLVLTRQARTADPDFLVIDQDGVEVPVAGELPATHADTASANRILGITDTASPLHQDSLNNLKALPLHLAESIRIDRPLAAVQVDHHCQGQ